MAIKVRLRSNESWRNSFVMFQKLSLFWYIYIKNNILEFLAHERYLFWDKLKVLKVLTSCETKIDWSVEDDHQQHTECCCQSLRAHLRVHLLECTSWSAQKPIQCLHWPRLFSGKYLFIWAEINSIVVNFLFVNSFEKQFVYLMY